MPEAPPRNKLAELAKPAELTLAQLLQFDGLKAGQWLMRLSIANGAGAWQPLTTDTATNDRMIKEAIAQSPSPVTELALGYAGMVDWRGSKRPMAYLQYYRSNYEQGLLCLRHLKEGPRTGTFEGFGGFFVAGACKNIWI